jgi:hypothetical protein
MKCMEERCMKMKSTAKSTSQMSTPAKEKPRLHKMRRSKITLASWEWTWRTPSTANYCGSLSAVFSLQYLNLGKKRKTLTIISSFTMLRQKYRLTNTPVTLNIVNSTREKGISF